MDDLVDPPVDSEGCDLIWYTAPSVVERRETGQFVDGFGGSVPRNEVQSRKICGSTGRTWLWFGLAFVVSRAEARDFVWENATLDVFFAPK
jgi:hypothetical protein